MKKISFILLAATTMLACNSNSQSSSSKSLVDSGTTTSGTITQTNAETVSGDCSSLLLFKKGTVVEGHTLNAEGTEINKQKTTVVNVGSEDGKTVSDVKMESEGVNIPATTFTAKYSCDGKFLYFDMNSLFSNLAKNGATIEGSPIQFPLVITSGQTLPDASYTISFNRGKTGMKVTSVIKNRKAGEQEQLTTPAGTFTCYKITADVESETEMSGMDEKAKEVMKKMKDKMPKSSFVMWYANNAGIVKMQMLTNGSVSSTTEITSIK